MSWSGMRGAVSLAAALAVPVAIEGERFDVRDLILFITFAVILATLVAQGLTLGPLIRALRLKDEGNQGTLMELRARLEGARAALERLERLCDDERVPQGAADARALRRPHPALRGRHRGGRRHRGVRSELRGLAQLAARPDRGRGRPSSRCAIAATSAPRSCAASSATWTSRSPGSAADGSIRVVRPLFRGRD